MEINRDREFHFTRQDFEKVRRMIYEHAGINLSDAKQDMVYSRLARRLRANNMQTFGQYLTLLESNNEKEWEAFVNSLTTNLTSFFREPHHFPLLADYLKTHGHGREVVIWCSASSTGEEPYSIAMTAVDAYNSFTPPVRILASDLDTNVLKKAETGMYPLERVEKLSEAQIKRFFLRGTGPNDGMVRVRPELRNLITFRQVNLLDSNWPMRGPIDIIFCRNVMIYFDKETQYSILKKFVPLLRHEGLLFAGHSESFHHAADLFHLRGRTVYELASHHKQAAQHGGHKR